MNKKELILRKKLLKAFPKEASHHFNNNSLPSLSDAVNLLYQQIDLKNTFENQLKQLKEIKKVNKRLFDIINKYREESK